MNVRLLALLLLLLLGAPRAEAHTFISPGGLYTLSYERPWMAGPSDADDGVLRQLFQTGLCVDKDLRLALDHYENAARAGNRHAALDLVRLYEAGTEVEQDLELAAHWKQVAGGTAKP